MDFKQYFEGFLDESKKIVMKTPIKNKINKEINKLLRPIYFKQIPLGDLFNILDKFGYVAVQEDGTKWSGMLMGGQDKTEQVNFDLGEKDSKDEKGMYNNVSNTRLIVTYYKLPSNKYEIVSYLS